MTGQGQESDRPWLLEYLAAIRIRPGIYLTEDVLGLGFYIRGRADSRSRLGLPEFLGAEATLLEEFTSWLREKLDRGRNFDWPMIVQLVDGSDRNISTFYKLFDEFLAFKGIEWPMAAGEALRQRWALGESA